jgi:hypothetical protein
VNIVCLILIKFWCHVFHWILFIKQVNNDESQDEISYGTTPRTEFQKYIRLKRNGVFYDYLIFEVYHALVVRFFNMLLLSELKISAVVLRTNVSYFDVFKLNFKLT